MEGHWQNSSVDVDFYGVVTFEVMMKEVVGMEYTNMLIEDSSRFVFEARTMVKRSFQNVDHFFNYYNLKEASLDENTCENNYYTPKLD